MRITDLPHWLVWKYEPSPGNPDRLTKIPYQPYRPDKRAIPDKADGGYTPFAIATACLLKKHGFDGIGFSVRIPIEKPEGMVLFGIDVDGWDNKTQENPFLADLAELFRGTYAETTPSGQGVHFVGLARRDRIPTREKLDKLYKTNNRDFGLECYIENGSYLSYTGKRISDAEELTDQTDALLYFLEEYMKRPTEPARNWKPAVADYGSANYEQRMAAAMRDKKFRSMYEHGEITGYPSQSEATLALLQRIIFYFGDDKSQIDAIFRGSALMRDKWDAKRPPHDGNPSHGTWGWNEIHTAIMTQTGKVFDPNYKKNQTMTASEFTGEVEPQEAAEMGLDATTAAPMTYSGNMTRFTAQAARGLPALKCGAWDATDAGIVKDTPNPNKVICAAKNPVLPCGILENLQTGKQSVRLAYGQALERKITVPRSTVSTTNKITMLSDYGLEVNSDTARPLMQFICECLTENEREALQPQKATSCMGWLKKSTGEYLTDDARPGSRAFAPYAANIECDLALDPGMSELYDTLTKSKGTLDGWRTIVQPIRARNLVVRVALAASLSSVLIEPCSALPYILTIIGQTGFGKTVSLMLAASVWGDPQNKKLVPTMSGTLNATMAAAEFLNNIPFFGDEFQAMADKYRNDFDGFIYNFTEGARKPRLNSDSTSQAVRGWKNAFLFTGEQSLLHNASKAGARNRVIELELSEKLFQTPGEANDVVAALAGCHGSAGRAFVEGLAALPVQDIAKAYRRAMDDLRAVSDATDKQISSGALILLADRYAKKFIWRDGIQLRPEELALFLKGDAETDVARSAYHAALELVALNQRSFILEGNPTQNNPDVIPEYPVSGNMPVWGKIEQPKGDKQTIWFAKNKLDAELRQAGFDFGSVKRAWAERGWITVFTRTTSGGRQTQSYTKPVRLHKILVECVGLTQTIHPDGQEDDAE